MLKMRKLLEPENSLVGIIERVPIVDDHDSEEMNTCHFEIIEVEDPVT
jgi:hypothetical protein